LKVKIFKDFNASGTEIKINKWFENKNINVLKMISTCSGELVIITILYEENN